MAQAGPLPLPPETCLPTPCPLLTEKEASANVRLRSSARRSGHRAEPACRTRCPRNRRCGHRPPRRDEAHCPTAASRPGHETLSLPRDASAPKDAVGFTNEDAKWQRTSPGSPCESSQAYGMCCTTVCNVVPSSMPSRTLPLHVSQKRARTRAMNTCDALRKGRKTWRRVRLGRMRTH